MLDETRKCAGITFDVAGDMEAEVNEMARAFIPTLAKDRQGETNTESGQAERNLNVRLFRQ